MNQSKDFTKKYQKSTGVSCPSCTREAELGRLIPGLMAAGDEMMAADCPVQDARGGKTNCTVHQAWKEADTSLSDLWLELENI